MPKEKRKQKTFLASTSHLLDAWEGFQRAFAACGDSDLKRILPQLVRRTMRGELTEEQARREIALLWEERGL